MNEAHGGKTCNTLKESFKRKAIKPKQTNKLGSLKASPWNPLNRSNLQATK